MEGWKLIDGTKIGREAKPLVKKFTAGAVAWIDKVDACRGKRRQSCSSVVRKLRLRNVFSKLLINHPSNYSNTFLASTT